MFNRQAAELNLYAFLTLTEKDTALKLKIQEFVAKPYTTKELYHFLSEIQTDLTQRYEEPEEYNDMQMIDLEWCEDQLNLHNRKIGRQ